MRVLLTGGTGFIGSHTAVVLLEGGHDVFICDNLCNSQVSTLDAVEAICGRRPVFYESDIRDRNAMRSILTDNGIEAVVHFAGTTLQAP